MNPPADTMPTRDQLAALLPGHQLESGFSLIPCRGGWNNRVWKLDIADRAWLLKQYFSSPQDPRPRLQHEYGFLRFAAEQGVARLPKAYASLPEAGLALYEWIDGLPFQEVEPQDVSQALSFIQDLNRHRVRAAELPQASEFCAGLSDHLAHLERRLQRFESLRQSPDQELGDLILLRLLPLWERVKDLLDTARVEAPGLYAALDADQLILSPSDFGFHNALQTASGPVFLDFEYAGWDDPAQLVCDFFSQFEVPAPATCFADFAAGVAALDPDPDWQLERMKLLLPVHRLKWIGIALNHFLPASAARRSFADAAAAAAARQRQLAKVGNLLDQLEKELSS